MIKSKSRFNLASDQYIKTCPICQKKFDTLIFTNNSYAWKITNSNYKCEDKKTVYFCSYTCKRNYEKKHISQQEIKIKDQINKELQGKARWNNCKERW